MIDSFFVQLRIYFISLAEGVDSYLNLDSVYQSASIPRRIP